MLSKEINIEQFKSINDLYTYADKNAFKLARSWELVNLWVRYKNQTNDDLEKKKSQWEIDCFVFDIKSDLLFSQIYSDGKNTVEIKKYPDLNEFQKEVVEYIEQRIKISNNSILKARYNHLLWKCPSDIKRTEFAQGAIENYINSIKEYYRLFLIDENKESPIQIGELFETLIAVSNQVRSDKNSLRDLTKFLLFEATKLEFYTREGILRDMLEFPKIFKPKDFENTLKLIENELNKDKTEIDDFSLVHNYLPTAIKIATKTNSDIKKWHNEMGLAYLRMANQIINEDRFWIKQDYHASATEAFKKAGNVVERNKVEKLYADLKPKIKLPLFKMDYTEEIQKSLKEHNEHLKIRATNCLKQDSDIIYRYISQGPFFPSYDNVIKESSKSSNAFLEFATNINFDKNKNIVKQKATNKELKKVFDSYKFQLDISVLPYLHYIIILGIKSGKLTFENFINYLVESTWIGKTYIRYDIGGNEQQINWIQQLSPSIVEFFLQVQAWSHSKYFTPSFILCIDSFTLKMEGIFRNFCERANIPISFDRDKGMQEAYINNVFDNETIINYFNEDDRLLFNYLFSNDGGMNLRNNVAHCFYLPNEYHPDKMLLLIAALLRLGKYDLKKREYQT
ncbi:MAG: DUF4209 domain-containing protein [Gelidibacter sp.]|nr:DUF4209 domain-containing protein [Gelidibacter sp.]